METTVIADAVNAAARLETATKTFDCSILLSRQSVELLAQPERFMLRYLGKIYVKGKSEKLGVDDAFDGDPPEVATHKQETLERFSQALEASTAGDWTTARETFAAIADAGPLDGPASYYLEQCGERVSEEVRR